MWSVLSWCGRVSLTCVLGMSWCGILWSMVSSSLTDTLETLIPCCPKVLLLNETLSLNLLSSQIRTLLVGLTAAKKNVSLTLEASTHPHMLTMATNIFFYMELSVARIYNANQKTIQAWVSMIRMIKELLEWKTRNLFIYLFFLFILFIYFALILWFCFLIHLTTTFWCNFKNAIVNCFTV